MAKTPSVTQKKMNLDYGQCFHCHRIMPVKYLTQIRFYEGHKHIGKFHHKLICIGCKEAADEIYNHVELGE